MAKVSRNDGWASSYLSYSLLLSILVPNLLIVTIRRLWYQTTTYKIKI